MWPRHLLFPSVISFVLFYQRSQHPTRLSVVTSSKFIRPNSAVADCISEQDCIAEFAVRNKVRRRSSHGLAALLPGANVTNHSETQRASSLRAGLGDEPSATLITPLLANFRATQGPNIARAFMSVIFEITTQSPPRLHCLCGGV